MSSKIEAIFFDLGETLINFGQIHVNLLFDAGAKLAYDYLKKLGQPLPPMAIYRRKQSWAINWAVIKSKLNRREFNSLDLLAETSSKLGQVLTRCQLLKLAGMFYEPLRRQAVVEDGVPNMLRRFTDDGLKLGIISNTFVPGEVLDKHLGTEGLLDFFPTRIYSCNVGRRKPHPRIFTEAVRQAGLNPPRTLFVGDLLRQDVSGANRAGMISVLKDPTDRHVGARTRPKHTIRGLLELTELVARYNGAGELANS